MCIIKLPVSETVGIRTEPNGKSAGWATPNISSGILCELEWRTKKVNIKTKKLVVTAMLIGIILLLGLTKIGMIPLGFINISILAIPVVIGTNLLGLNVGLILGVFFGGLSALSAFGIYGAPSGLVAPILAASPALAAVLCFAPRLLVPVCTYLAGRLWGRERKGLILSAIVGSLTNTVFYLGMMLLFYVLLGLDAASVLAIIGGTGLIAGGLEAAANALISTPVILAVRKTMR